MGGFQDKFLIVISNCRKLQNICIPNFRITICRWWSFI